MSQPDSGRLVGDIERALAELLDATGASRATLRADDTARGWTSNVPCAEVLRDGAPTMLNDSSLDHRAAATIRWLDETRSILVQPDLAGAAPSPPRALMDAHLAKAQMVGPVVAGDSLYGWVSAHDIKGARPWSAPDQAAMRRAVATISALLGLAAQ